MKTWNQILELYPVDELLFRLIEISILHLPPSDRNHITGFELFCNLKYAHIFISIDTNDQTAKNKTLVDERVMGSATNQLDETEGRESNTMNWKYYQFNTDMPGIREIWRKEWGEVQKFLSDDMYDEYLEFLNVNEEEANKRQMENEKALEQTVRQVYERIKNEVLSQVTTIKRLGCNLVFQENYY